MHDAQLAEQVESGRAQWVDGPEQFCCMSGHCDECRDSQAVYSWLLVSAGRFLRTPAFAKAWIDLAEGYWKQFVWSPLK